MKAKEGWDVDIDIDMHCILHFWIGSGGGGGVMACARFRQGVKAGVGGNPWDGVTYYVLAPVAARGLYPQKVSILP